MRRRLYRNYALALVLAMTFSVQHATAQDIVVNVSAKNRVLPPQLMLYIHDPSQFFTVQLTNTTSTAQQVYLSLNLTHVLPDDGLMAATPDKYQPTRPFTVPSHGVYSLNLADMKNLFNHIPSSAMKMPDGIIDGYANGSFGLLPEGDYTVKFAAFKWTGNNHDTPFLLSSPSSGQCNFTVCYNASAPTWLQPIAAMSSSDYVELNRLSPVFTWTAPMMGCNPSQTYSYTIRIVEVLDTQAPDVAMDHNGTVYFKEGLTTPMLTLPTTVVNNLDPKKKYAAQIIAKALNTSTMNYVQIANSGKSSLCLFKVAEASKPKKYEFEMDDVEDSLYATMSYVFKNPRIIQPYFPEGSARRIYQTMDIEVEWTAPWYEGGIGKDPDDLKMEYTIQLYNGKKEADKAKAMKDANLIYSHKTKELLDTIPWDSIEKKVSAKDYLVLRVVPSCLGVDKDSIVFQNDTVNIKDFTLLDFIGANYFRCSNSVEVENNTPTTKKKEDFKGKEVTLGQYKLTIDEIESGSGEKGFKGKGRVKWELSLGTLMVHVKFDALKINTDDVVFEGSAKGYKDPKAGDAAAAVDSLFSDIGLNDLLADAGVPYADKITSGTKKTIASKVPEIATYYDLVKKSENIWDLLKGGDVNVYLPICMPEGVESLAGKLPVDIQITTMEFAPTYATMDLLGEYVMPESKNIASDLLVFGAPRLCISPDHILPESGQLALLDKFVITEPSSGYECTFKAPKDLLEPIDGCYVSWKNYEFETMGIDVDMKIPKLKKYDMTSKKVTDELPTLTINTSISSWDDFVVNEITMEPFEVDALPGYTFQVKKMAYDHSYVRNATAMGSYKFLSKYKKKEGIGEAVYAKYGDNGWQGFYVEELTIMLPEGLTSDDDESTERLSIDAKNFLIDASGVTINCKVEELFSGSAGGFSLDIQEIGLQFIQSNFDNCYFNGNIGLPLLKDKDDKQAKVGFNCQVRHQLDESNKETENFAYVFNTKQINGDYNLDLYAARIVLDANQTYFLLESEPKNAHEKKSETNKMVTRCELMMGGRMEVGRKADAEDIIKEKLGFELGIPDVHFVGMRIANCKTWKSKYVKLQANIDSLRHIQDSVAIAGLYLAGKEIANKDSTFFFHTGSWSLASKSKKLGPFEFSLVNYEFKTDFKGGNLSVGLGLCGRVDIVKGIDLGAQAGVTIYGSIKNIDIKNLDNLECSLDSARLDSIGVHASFSGVEFDGNLYFENNKKSDKGKGFTAAFVLKLPGNLFSMKASGAYYEKEGETDEDSYTWGYLNLKLLGAHIELGPVVITGLGGGFYFNCSPTSKNDKGEFTTADVVNKNGLIGMSVFMSMASPDEKAVTGNLDLAVVYNKKLKCLSNFVMTGNVKAVGGIINADLSLVYECTPTEKYLQLNITADAKLDYDAADYVGDFAGELKSVKAQLDEISGSKFDILAGCKQGLDSKIGANAEEPKKDEKPKEEPKENNAKDAAKTEEQKKMASTCTATVTLDVKITWKSGGVEHKNPKWHFYLGEPAEDKRCSVVLIDYGKEGDIVHCKIGGNAYLCFGNELPDNGQLPPIPTKITEFLDGSSKGEGVVSDNVDKAIEARNAALNTFKMSGAGVMLGAQAYGNIGLDLGLIYGNMDAIAGFDIAVTHVAQGLCVNLGKKPGYNGWYGRGQLYAYLAMQLGARFNLGFVKYDIPLVDAGVGGVLSFGGPSPFYFQGKVRAKLELIGGLFQLDKTYKFDVGQQCTLFHGNALDNFMLFSDCSLGDTIKAKGWATSDSNIDAQQFVDRNVRTPQYINTEAPLGEHFRIIDENELDRITNNAQIQPGTEAYNKFYMQACRTFRFKPEAWNHYAVTQDERYSQYADKQYVLLYEYDKPSDDTYPDYKVRTEKTNLERLNYGQRKVYVIPFADNGTAVHHYLDLPVLRNALRAGKYYRLMVTGKAEELHEGVWKDPWTCDTVKSECDYVPWSRTVNFYFRTKTDESVDDKAPLSDYVAIAYPSNNNMLNNEDANSSTVTYIPAYLNDVKAPTIALNRDIRVVAFKKGSLYWRLLNPMGKQLDIAKNVYVSYRDAGGNVVGINMEPQRLLNAQANQKYILELNYFTEGTKVNESGADVSEVVDTCLLRLYVETLPSDKDWRTGSADKATKVKYDQAYMATKLVDYKMDNAPMSKRPTDVQLLNSGDYLYDPFWYIGWNSNFAFPGGWNITECNYFGIEVTTSESVIFNGHNGKYEGMYNQMPEHSSSASNDYETIRSKAIYKLDKSKAMVYNASDQWPLSYIAGEGNSSAYSYDNRIFPYRQTGTFNQNEVYRNTSELFSDIGFVYDATERFCKNINALANSFGQTHYAYRHYGESDMKKYLRNWYVSHRGQYVTNEWKSTEGIGGGLRDASTSTTNDGKKVATTKFTLSVPAYMFPTIWSVTRLERDGEAFKGMSGDCDRAENAHLIWGYMSNSYYTKFYSRDGNHYSYEPYETPLKQRIFDAAAAKEHFKEATVVCYRVNAYDFTNGRYGVTSLLNGSPAFMATIKNPLLSASVTDWQAGGYNDWNNGYSTGIDLNTDVSGVDKSTGSAMDSKTIDSLATIISDANKSLVTRMEVVRKNGWTTYENKLTSLKNSSAKAIDYAKKALVLACYESDAYTSDIASNKNFYKSFLSDCENYLTDITNLQTEASVNFHDNTSGYNKTYEGMHNLLCNAWDELKKVSDERSKEYKHYNELYNAGHEAYLTMLEWGDSIERSATSGEAYLANEDAKNAQSYIDKCYWKNIQDSRHLKNDLQSMLNNAHGHNVSAGQDFQAAQDTIKATSEYMSYIDTQFRINSASAKDADVLRAWRYRLALYNTHLATIEPHLASIKTHVAETNTIVKEANETKTTILSMLVEEAPTYKDASAMVEKIEMTRDSIVDLSSKLEELISGDNGSIRQSLKILINHIDSVVDGLLGRDKAAALAILHQLDSLNKIRLDVYWKPYMNGTDGYSGVEEMFTLYETIVRNRKAYKSGSISDIQTCIDNCQQFKTRVPELDDARRAARTNTDNMSKPYFEALKAAGYTSTDPYWLNAQYKYDSPRMKMEKDYNNLGELTGLLERILDGRVWGTYVGSDAWLASFNKKFADKTELSKYFAGVNDIQKEAEAMKENPTEAYTKLIPIVQAELVAMNNRAKAAASTPINDKKRDVFFDGRTPPTTECSTFRKDAETSMNDYRSRLTKEWDGWQLSMMLNEHTSGTPASYLSNVVSNCNNFNAKLTSYTEKMVEVNELAAMLTDTLAKVDSLLSVIPTSANPYSANFNTLAKSIRNYYTSAPWDKVTTYTTIFNDLTKVHAEVMEPMRIEATEALNYLAEYGELKLTDEQRTQREAYLATYATLGIYRDRIDKYFTSGTYNRAADVDSLINSYNNLNTTWLPLMRDNKTKIDAISDPNDALGPDFNKQIQLYGYTNTFVTTYLTVRQRCKPYYNTASLVLDELNDVRDAYEQMKAYASSEELSKYAAMISKIDKAATTASSYSPKMRTLYDEAQSMPYSQYNTLMKKSLSRIKSYTRNDVNTLKYQADSIYQLVRNKYNSMLSSWIKAENAYTEAFAIMPGTYAKRTYICDYCTTGITYYSVITDWYYSGFSTNHAQLVKIKTAINNLIKPAVAVGLSADELDGGALSLIEGYRSEVADFKAAIKPKFDVAVTKKRELQERYDKYVIK